MYTEDPAAEGGLKVTQLTTVGWASGYAGEIADFAKCTMRVQIIIRHA